MTDSDTVSLTVTDASGGSISLDLESSENKRNSKSSSGNATGSGRTKVSLKPGRSLMHWIRLGNSTNDLAGTGGQILRVTPAMLAKHSSRDDCWLAIRGKVYNVTPYLEYHPGGEDELMRGAGRDATHLFNEAHKWVNFEGMLKKCFVGPLAVEYDMSDLEAAINESKARCDTQSNGISSNK